MANSEIYAGGELPRDPLPTLRSWLAAAQALPRLSNPTAMTLATVNEHGDPEARMVICRGWDTTDGWLVFYTDRRSMKAVELDRRPRAALAFFWPALHRQLRIAGPVTPVSDAEADAHFASRPVGNQVAIWASRQSAELDSRAALVDRYRATLGRFGLDSDQGGPADLPRPESWCGYRVWIERLELWIGQPDRLHDRLHYERALAAGRNGFAGGAWSAKRLEP